MSEADVMPTSMTDFVGQWIQAIEAAKTDEKEWRKEAERALKAFRGEQGSASRNFNLYHSNIQTLVPAIYNSTPIPDVRRRYGDTDVVGKFAADLLERALSYTLDSYDFDNRVRLAVYDMAVSGRGVLRVRYEPVAGPMGIAEQRVEIDPVQWDRFIRGPTLTWSDTPWIAFEHYLDREEVAKLAPEAVEKVPFSHTATGRDDKASGETEMPAAFKRAKIYEIWDRTTRRVIFLCPEWTEAVIRMENDPLGLDGFFPLPRPMHAVATVGNMSPVCPLAIYGSLLDELNEITRRITKLIKQLRPRGGYVGNSLDVKAMAEAGDGELVPFSGVETQLSTAGGGIERSIVWFPMEPTVLALRELYQQREAVKQTIYEVTGIADIMRGATNASETATAQNLKAQFGSIRVRDMQAEAQRFVRDIIRIKAEIIAKQFEPPVLMEMTGIKLIPRQMQAMAKQMAQANPEQAQAIAQANPDIAKAVQGPALEDVFQVLRSPKTRGYRIDIETDSTIRGDMMRAQEQMNAFMQGTASYMQAIGPLVAQGTVPPGPAIELYLSFARQFNLGKSAEDALEKLAEAGANAQQKPPGEDNANDAAMARVEMQGQAKSAELKMKAQAAEREAALEAQVQQLKAQIEMMKITSKAETERYKVDRQVDAKMADQALKAFGALQDRGAGPIA